MYIDENFNITNGETAQDRLLKAVYSNAFLRLLIKPLTLPTISKIAGRFLDSRLSYHLIKPFIKANKIDMREYEPKRFVSFNDFFTRRIKNGLRPVNKDAKIISPCDGKVSAYKIGDDSIFKIKHSLYSIRSLTKSKTLSEKFKGGTAVIIRLCVDDYHRYCYPISGVKSTNVFIPGFLHTVNPAALEKEKVFIENSREYCLIKNKDTKLVQIEVGALMVGKISNNEMFTSKVTKGEEKGCFEFGGSTIVLLLDSKTEVRPDFFKNTELGLETIIKQGEAISF